MLMEVQDLLKNSEAIMCDIIYSGKAPIGIFGMVIFYKLRQVVPNIELRGM